MARAVWLGVGAEESLASTAEMGRKRIGPHGAARPGGQRGTTARWLRRSAFVPVMECADLGQLYKPTRRRRLHLSWLGSVGFGQLPLISHDWAAKALSNERMLGVLPIRLCLPDYRTGLHDARPWPGIHEELVMEL